ncbi:hypothetical protein L6R53_19735 [Myxococcota bacterium]|nr:hypothetical protein [Myxococcota bacterium]
MVQDDETARVWESWEATWRDTWVLDGGNEACGVYNLTEHDLSDPVEYAGLYDLLVACAGG